MQGGTNQPPSAIASRRSLSLEPVALLALGLFLGLSVRGISIKPHGDFYGIWETGAALLDGELPASFKRAPLYPLLVAAGGRLLEAAGFKEAPAQLAAQWINALLLPVNAMLLYWLARALSPPGPAAWAAWWFLLLPVGLYCTTNELVEPLLIFTVLLTLLCTSRRPRLAYACAAAAALSRYDAIGLLMGLVLIDLRRRLPLKAILLRVLPAVTPLALWLLLTALTWPQRGADHYLTELLERPRFDPASVLVTAHRAVSPADAPRIPLIGADLQPLVNFLTQAGLVVLAIGGIAIGIAAQGALTTVALTFAAVYVLAHAVFPFTFDRFGYPLAPVYLALAAAGAGAAGVPDAVRRLRHAGFVLAVVVGLLLLLTIGSELDCWRFLAAGRYRWALPLPAAVLLAAGFLWGLSRSGPTPARVNLLLAAAALALVQLRSAAAQIAGGAQMENLVVAARWVRDNLPPDQRVLSAMPGLLRLYAGRKPADRFVGFEQIEASSWPEILRECRQRGIRYLIWYEGLFAEVGDYYVQKYRLDRFACLSRPQELERVCPERFWPGHPDLWILRIDP